MEQSFFFQLDQWNWFILAALFAVLEVIAPGYLLMWYGVAAAFVGALALLVDLSWQMQLALYSLIGIGLLVVSIRFAGRGRSSDRPLLNRRAETHIGRIYTLASATSNGRGRLQVDDSEWSVRLADGAELPAGAKVVITGLEGTTLIGRAA